MKRAFVIIAMVVMVLASTIAEAGSTGFFKKRMWARHEHGINGVIRCFKEAASPAEYEPYIFDIVSAETNLIAAGISPNDKRFVGRLGMGIRTRADYPLLGYRLLRWKFQRLTGIELRPEGPFVGEHYRVRSRSGEFKGTVRFKVYDY